VQQLGWIRQQRRCDLKEHDLYTGSAGALAESFPV
jgi:hypothetical protein